MVEYNPSEWFWRVAGDPDHVYSSAADVFIPVTDADYQSWLAQGGITTPIATADELWDVLRAAGVPFTQRIFSNGAWTLDLEAYRAGRLAALADYRWRVETGGLNWNGYTIPTDDRSKTLINAAADRARRSDTPPSAGWKISADTWIDATVQQMTDLQEAVEAFVDACFAHERQLAQDILDASDEGALDAVDIESGWPADSVLAGGGS